ncbi:MAG: hypothetical protein MZW92_29380 [Comamonadaceae bacterium]|nr:hypothetical protein [Comamonadaceae bacterium]
MNGPEPDFLACRDPCPLRAVGTSHPGNIGAAARAMKTMGFCRPGAGGSRASFRASRDAVALRHRCERCARPRARRAQRWPQALAGVTLIAVRHRDDAGASFGRADALRRGDALRRCCAGRAAGRAWRCVFGTERVGPGQRRRSTACQCLRDDPDRIRTTASLNLAQAVQLARLRVAAWRWPAARSRAAGTRVRAPPASSEIEASARPPGAGAASRAAFSTRRRRSSLMPRLRRAVQPRARLERRGSQHPARHACERSCCVAKID